jgi:hypothetical protein
VKIEGGKAIQAAIADEIKRRGNEIIRSILRVTRCSSSTVNDLGWVIARRSDMVGVCTARVNAQLMMMCVQFFLAIAGLARINK